MGKENVQEKKPTRKRKKQNHSLQKIKKFQRRINRPTLKKPNTRRKTTAKKQQKTQQKRLRTKSYNQILYLLQGGGALGAYQVGVCSGLIENNYDPTWIIGTSIGGINGSIIAGSPPKDRIKNLKRFWKEITSPYSNFLYESHDVNIRQCQSAWISQCILMFGLPNFFTPRPFTPWFYENTPNKLSFYDTAPLKKTLENIIDFDLINQQKIRLSLGAVSVEEGNPIHFDNTRQKIGVEHVMASAAIPPGFPAIHIKNKDYWDGGLNSNTPLSVILEEKIQHKILCFMVNLFPYQSRAPANMLDVVTRKKDLEFISHYHSILNYFYERHRLRLNLKRLWEERDKKYIDPFIKKEIKNEFPATLNIMLFQYKNRPYDLWSKDFDFSKIAIEEHYDDGYNDFQNAKSRIKTLEAIKDFDIKLNTF